MPEGTTALWADRSEAGQLRARYRSDQAPVERGQLRCFEERLGEHGPEQERRVELCVEAGAVLASE